jgi:hypothetical protein
MSFRPPRIATLVVEGKPCARLVQNAARLRLLDQVLNQLSCLPWGPLDALLLPGGFLRFPAWPREQDNALRQRLILEHPAGTALLSAATRLQHAHPGALLVVGIDTLRRSGEDGGQQACVAFGGSGIVGLAHKIYPVDGDTNFATLPPLMTYAADYAAPARFVSLPNGSRAVLCACYDAFGLSATAPDHAAIRYLWSEGAEHDSDSPAFPALRRQCLALSRRVLKEQAPDLALVAIHDFKHLGATGLWQRHGLASAAAALGGIGTGQGFAVAAAHTERFLTLEAAPACRQGALAAYGVQKQHLTQGCYRKAHVLPAVSACFLAGKDHPRGLLRLYAPAG